MLKKPLRKPFVVQYAGVYELAHTCEAVAIEDEVDLED
jgi:hypothetical protein